MSDEFEEDLVVAQLRCCGVIEAVRVSRAGFPNRYPLAEYCQRYRCLVQAAAADDRSGAQLGGERGASVVGVGAAELRKLAEPLSVHATSDELRAASERLSTFLASRLLEHPGFRPAFTDFSKVGGGSSNGAAPDSGRDTTGVGKSLGVLERAGMQVGRTQVFLRQAAFDVLEQLRFLLQRASAILLQACARRHLCCARYQLMRTAALTLHCRARVMLACRRWKHLRERRASILLQRMALGWQARETGSAQAAAAGAYPGGAAGPARPPMRTGCALGPSCDPNQQVLPKVTSLPLEFFIFIYS